MESRGPAIARVRNAAALSEGDASLSALNTTVDGTRAFLLDKSYAYVEVEPGGRVPQPESDRRGGHRRSPRAELHLRGCSPLWTR